MDEQELKRLEMRVKFGRGNEELDLVQCAALRDLIAEVRRLRMENEEKDREIERLHMNGRVFSPGKISDLKGLEWA